MTIIDKALDGLSRDFSEVFTFSDYEARGIGEAYLEELRLYISNSDRWGNIGDYTHEIIDSMVPIYYSDQIDEINKYQLWTYESEVGAASTIGQLAINVLYSYYSEIIYSMESTIIEAIDKAFDESRCGLCFEEYEGDNFSGWIQLEHKCPALKEGEESNE